MEYILALKLRHSYIFSHKYAAYRPPFALLPTVSGKMTVAEQEQSWKN